LQDRALGVLEYKRRLRIRLVLKPIQKDSIFIAVLGAQLERGFVAAVRSKTEMPVPRRRVPSMVTIHMLRVIMNMKMLRRRVAERRKNGEAHLNGDGPKHYEDCTCYCADCASAVRIAAPRK